MARRAYSVFLYVGSAAGKDISDLVEIKKDFQLKEFSLESGTEIQSPDFSFQASKQLSLLTGQFLSNINGHFIEVVDEQDRTVWAGFIDDIQETKQGTLTVKSKSIIGTLSNLQMVTDPPLTLDGSTPHYPTDVIQAIYDGTGLNIPAKYIDRVTFDSVKAQTGQRIYFNFADDIKALDAIQECMLCGGFVVYTHHNVFKAKVANRYPLKFAIDENELTARADYSFKRDEVKTAVKGFYFPSTPVDFFGDPNEILAFGLRPFVIKHAIENAASPEQIAERILNLYLCSQSQNVLTVDLDVSWLTESQRQKYYILEMFDTVGFHTPEIYGEGFVIEKESTGIEISMKIRCFAWNLRQEIADLFQFTGDGLRFDGNYYLEYEIYEDGQWVKYPLRRFQSLDISDLPQPVLLRYRIFKDGQYSRYRTLSLTTDISGSGPFYIGAGFYGGDNPGPFLDDEAGDPLLYEWGGMVEV